MTATDEAATAVGRRAKRRIAFFALVGLIGAVYVCNTSWLAAPLEGVPRILSHRGVHTAFERDGLNNETCTAARSIPPVRLPIENTIDSMELAFAYGADVVELDVNLTADGQFAVFHDWTVDCRTEGRGKLRDHSLTSLRRLDIGFGYTADGGVTFPLRGKGVGLLPSLPEVLDHFPDRKFLIDFKSNEGDDGDRLAKLLFDNGSWTQQVWGAYGGRNPVERLLTQNLGIRGFHRETVEECLLKYVLLGWSGYVPKSCKGTVVLVPIDVAPFLWGWPNRFIHRISGSGSIVVIRGPVRGPGASDGVDSTSLLARVPKSHAIYVWTNSLAVLKRLSDPAEARLSSVGTPFNFNREDRND